MESELEGHKSKLVVEGEDFNTIDAFRLIDKNGNGAVSKNEIIDFLAKEVRDEIPFSADEINMFFVRFDKNEK